MFKNWWQKARPKVLGTIVWSVARLVGKTLRIRVENWGVVQERINNGQGAVLVSWHGRTFVPANQFCGKKFITLISVSRDGEIQNVIFTRFGFKTIRGSTKRQGVRAALEAARDVRNGGILAFTPDGPRGPTHKVQPGALFIAQKSGCPVIPVGVSAYPRIQISTWDRYLIPLAFARACMIIGDPIVIPPDADEETLQLLTNHIEHNISSLELEAEKRTGGFRG
jgi:lysophospholipid acyltransferase (LPLAT)-like uncharacterized protein